VDCVSHNGEHKVRVHSLSYVMMMMMMMMMMMPERLDRRRLPFICHVVGNDILVAWANLTCPVLSCPVLSCPVLFCPVLSCPSLIGAQVVAFWVYDKRKTEGCDFAYYGLRLFETADGVWCM
jgi:hypothetical protein